MSARNPIAMATRGDFNVGLSDEQEIEEVARQNRKALSSI